MRTPPAAPRTEWSDPHFRDIAVLVRQRSGLIFSGTRIGSAEDAMRRAMARSGLATPAELHRRVLSIGEAWSALMDELTIGESYFFREPRQLDLVRRTLVTMAEDPARRRAPLKLWSAGCAAGEEPYSLAILLLESGLDAGARIVGSDVSVARLAAARRARYGRWALRGVSDQRIDRYFEREGKQFVLDERIRHMVDFRAINLVSDELPAPSIGLDAMDVILCRNVLIYMELPTVAAIATRLLATLSPGGLLFLGASDPPLGSLIECEAITTADGTAYRRQGGESPPAVPSFRVRWHPPAAGFEPPPARSAFAASVEPAAGAPAQPPPIPAFPLVAESPAATMTGDTAATRPAGVGDARPTDDRDGARAAYRAGDYERSAVLARARIEERRRARRDRTVGAADDPGGHDDERDAVLLVRSLANLGRIAEAAEACAAAIDRHRTSPELAYLYALLLLHAGHAEAAATAARRALYLDRSFVLAHLALGDAFVRLGQPGRARRAYRNAVVLLESAPADAVVPGSDGEPAARFLRIGLDQLGTLESPSATTRSTV